MMMLSCLVPLAFLGPLDTFLRSNSEAFFLMDRTLWLIVTLTFLLAGWIQIYHENHDNEIGYASRQQTHYYNKRASDDNNNNGGAVKEGKLNLTSEMKERSNDDLGAHEGGGRPSLHRSPSPGASPTNGLSASTSPTNGTTSPVHNAIMTGGGGIVTAPCTPVNGAICNASLDTSSNLNLTLNSTNNTPTNGANVNMIRDAVDRPERASINVVGTPSHHLHSGVSFRVKRPSHEPPQPPPPPQQERERERERERRRRSRHGNTKIDKGSVTYVLHRVILLNGVLSCTRLLDLISYFIQFHHPTSAITFSLLSIFNAIATVSIYLSVFAIVGGFFLIMYHAIRSQQLTISFTNSSNHQAVITSLRYGLLGSAVTLLVAALLAASLQISLNLMWFQILLNIAVCMITPVVGYLLHNSISSILQYDSNIRRHTLGGMANANADSAMLAATVKLKKDKQEEEERAFARKLHAKRTFLEPTTASSSVSSASNSPLQATRSLLDNSNVTGLMNSNTLTPNMADSPASYIHHRLMEHASQYSSVAGGYTRDNRTSLSQLSASHSSAAVSRRNSLNFIAVDTVRISNSSGGSVTSSGMATMTPTSQSSTPTASTALLSAAAAGIGGGGGLARSSFTLSVPSQTAVGSPPSSPTNVSSPAIVTSSESENEDIDIVDASSPASTCVAPTSASASTATAPILTSQQQREEEKASLPVSSGSSLRPSLLTVNTSPGGSPVQPGRIIEFRVISTDSQNNNSNNTGAQHPHVGLTASITSSSSGVSHSNVPSPSGSPLGSPALVPRSLPVSPSQEKPAVAAAGSVPLARPASPNRKQQAFDRLRRLRGYVWPATLNGLVWHALLLIWHLLTFGIQFYPYSLKSDVTMAQGGVFAPTSTLIASTWQFDPVSLHMAFNTFIFVWFTWKEIDFRAFFTHLTSGGFLLCPRVWSCLCCRRCTGLYEEFDVYTPSEHAGVDRPSNLPTMMLVPPSGGKTPSPQNSPPNTQRAGPGGPHHHQKRRSLSIGSDSNTDEGNGSGDGIDGYGFNTGPAFSPLTKRDSVWSGPPTPGARRNGAGSGTGTGKKLNFNFGHTTTRPDDRDSGENSGSVHSSTHSSPAGSRNTSPTHAHTANGRFWENTPAGPNSNNGSAGSGTGSGHSHHSHTNSGSGTQANVATSSVGVGGAVSVTVPAFPAPPKQRRVSLTVPTVAELGHYQPGHAHHHSSHSHSRTTSLEVASADASSQPVVSFSISIGGGGAGSGTSHHSEDAISTATVEAVDLELEYEDSSDRKRERGHRGSVTGSVGSADSLPLTNSNSGSRSGGHIHTHGRSRSNEHDDDADDDDPEFTDSGNVSCGEAYALSNSNNVTILKGRSGSGSSGSPAQPSGGRKLSMPIVVYQPTPTNSSPPPSMRAIGTSSSLSPTHAASGNDGSGSSSPKRHFSLVPSSLLSISADVLSSSASDADNVPSPLNVITE